MTNRREFKESLKEMTSAERTAFLYLEELILQKHLEILKQIPPRTQPQNVDLSPLENKVDGLYKEWAIIKNDIKKPYENAKKDLEKWSGFIIKDQTKFLDDCVELNKDTRFLTSYVENLFDKLPESHKVTLTRKDMRNPNYKKIREEISTKKE